MTVPRGNGRRLNGAGSLRRPGLAEGQPRDPKVGITGASAVELRAQAWSPGTEFLDAETGRQKSPPKRVITHRDKIRELSGRTPRRNALFGVLPEKRGLQGLGGGVRSPVRTGLH